MPILDVFNSDAFSAVSLSKAVDKLDYVPGFLGSIPGLFEPVPVRTTSIWVEERSTGATVLQTSPRGAPPNATGGDIRKARNFSTVRVADASRITASELQDIRSWGSEDLPKTLADEVARRQFKMMRNLDVTLEYHRLGCVQGTLLDADGSTIYAWDTEFAQTIPAEVDFDLDNASPASGALRKKCTVAIRSITQGLKGMVPQRIVALCGDAFWDDLVAHPEVRTRYNHDTVATWLAMGMAYETLDFGGISWVNYRGTDDGSSISVGTDKAKFFPITAGGSIFQWVQAPGETFANVNMMGQPFYSQLVADLQRDAWVDVEMTAYPLFVCTMPQALYRARRT
jgi:hypothetical protein